MDRDEEDCHALKEQLETMAREANLHTKSRPGQDRRFHVVNRIVIEELEAWFLGAPDALCQAYPRVSQTFIKKKKYRTPDEIAGAWEALLRVLQRAGYYKGQKRLPKMEVARNIARHLDPHNNASPSFHCFVRELKALASA